MPTLSHVCLRGLDLEASTDFYRQALGLTVQRELAMPDRGWQLRFLGDGKTDFQLELCKETARTRPYHLGDDTPHIALRAEAFDDLKARHRDQGLICDELASGIYFIQDPDGHLIEILPPL